MGGTNRYGYVGQSPLLFADPLGLIYRYHGNDYQQHRQAGRAGCDQPIWLLGVIVGWEDCSDQARGTPCPDEGANPEMSDGGYGDFKDKWDRFNEAAKINRKQEESAVGPRLRRAAENVEKCFSDALGRQQPVGPN